MVSNMIYLQSVEEARPVKASEVGEQMDAQVAFLENEKIIQKPNSGLHQKKWRDKRGGGSAVDTSGHLHYSLIKTYCCYNWLYN